MGDSKTPPARDPKAPPLAESKAPLVNESNAPPAGDLKALLVAESKAQPVADLKAPPMFSLRLVRVWWDWCAIAHGWVDGLGWWWVGAVMTR